MAFPFGSGGSFFFIYYSPTCTSCDDIPEPVQRGAPSESGRRVDLAL